MRTVFKYQIDLYGGAQSIRMPQGAILLHVGRDHSTPNPDIVSMWYEVDTEAPYIERVYTIRGTGHPIPDGTTYVGTVIAPPFVWHIYQVTDEQ
jgi:hypothetical protein